MGATKEQENEALANEKPVKTVNVTDFYIGKHEVTQELWKAVMGNNPSRFKGDDKPVKDMTWRLCNKFISKLNALTGMESDLPPRKNGNMPQEVATIRPDTNSAAATISMKWLGS